MGPELAAGSSKLVRHIPGMRTLFGLVAVLVLGGLEMAACRLEAVSSIADTSFVDVESMLPICNARHIDVDQNTAGCLCEGSTANLLTL